jgi:hypothetical protein
MIIGNPVTTTRAGDILIGFVVGHPSGTVSEGAGFAPRNGFDGDLVEDEPAPTPGTYTPTAMVDPNGTWTMYGVAFR